MPCEFCPVLEECTRVFSLKLSRPELVQAIAMMIRKYPDLPACKDIPLQDQVLAAMLAGNHASIAELPDRRFDRTPAQPEGKTREFKFLDLRDGK
jgi:hypothetical protein